jgi:hypothetical protein
MPELDFQLAVLEREEGENRSIRKDTQMMFLLRTAFWTSVALALLPSFVPAQSSNVPIDLRASEAVTAASQTVADVSTFCERRHEACAAGAEFIAAFGQRVQAGAKILFEFAGDRLNKPERPATPSSAAAAPSVLPTTADAAKASQHTLTSADMAPAWRGPSPRRDGKGAT